MPLVRVGCVEFPPYSYTDATGKAAGQLINLATRILDSHAISWTAACYPGARLMAGLREGGVDLAMIVRNPEVVDYTDYGQTPLSYLELNAYRRDNTPPLGSLENARGKSLILLRGYGYGGKLAFFQDQAHDITSYFADSHTIALRMLLNKRADYMIDYRDPAEAAISESATTGLQREQLSRLPIFFVVSKHHRNSRQLLERLESALLTDVGQLRDTSH